MSRVNNQLLFTENRRPAALFSGRSTRTKSAAPSTSPSHTARNAITVGGKKRSDTADPESNPEASPISAAAEQAEVSVPFGCGLTFPVSQGHDTGSHLYHDVYAWVDRDTGQPLTRPMVTDICFDCASHYHLTSLLVIDAERAARGGAA